VSSNSTSEEEEETEEETEEEEEIEGAAYLPPSPSLPLTYAQVMQRQKVSIEQCAKVSKELMEMLHEKAPSLAGARGPSEPVPAKNIGLALVNGKRLTLCGGCGYGFSAAYSSPRQGSKPHHFCFRERGEAIPQHCKYSSPPPYPPFFPPPPSFYSILYSSPFYPPLPRPWHHLLLPVGLYWLPLG